MFQLTVWTPNKHYTKQYESVDDAIREAMKIEKYYEKGGFKFHDSKNELCYFDRYAERQIYEDIVVKIHIAVESYCPREIKTEEFPWD